MRDLACALLATLGDIPQEAHARGVGAVWALPRRRAIPRPIVVGHDVRAELEGVRQELLEVGPRADGPTDDAAPESGRSVDLVVQEPELLASLETRELRNALT